MTQMTAIATAGATSTNAERIRSNYANFDVHAQNAERCFARGDLEASAAHASLAAWVAAHSHCGFFASPRIERLLTAIGKRMVTPLPPVDAKRTEPFRRVLHVSGEVSAVGGLATMLRRWIESDPGRTHSVALTQQAGACPDQLVETVTKAGGRIHLLSRIGGLRRIVGELRSIARGYDIIVLHIPNSDVVASIAFADTARFPPVLFLNHSDHMFWVGAAISQVVGSMRKAACDITGERRYIEERRNLLLPILVSPVVRQRSREDAKKALSLDPSTVLMVSVARVQKYRSIDGVSYADTHVPVLKRYPNAQLIVVGGGDRPDWSEASNAVGGRISSLPPQDPRPYLEAADIYVDSYPFSSATSMMEAAGYGLPCAGRFILGEAARICGMDHPGLAGPLLEAKNDAGYVENLSKLISDPDLRARLGAEIQSSVAGANVSPGWNSYLEAAFARAAELPPVDSDAQFDGHPTEELRFGEPDIRLEDIYGFSPPQIDLVRGHLGIFPLRERLRLWMDVLRAGAFVGVKDAVKGLLPRWLVLRIKNSR